MTDYYLADFYLTDFEEMIKGATYHWNEYLCSHDDWYWETTVSNFRVAFKMMRSLTAKEGASRVEADTDRQSRPELFDLWDDICKCHTLLLTYVSDPLSHVNMIEGILCESRWLQHPVVTPELIAIKKKLNESPAIYQLQEAAKKIIWAGGEEPSVQEHLERALQAIAAASDALQGETWLSFPVAFPVYRMVHIYKNQAAKDAGDLWHTVKHDMSKPTIFFRGKTLSVSCEGDDYFALVTKKKNKRTVS